MLYVLDTFALMAYLRHEKDFNKVRTIILETSLANARVICPSSTSANFTICNRARAA